MFPRKRFYSLLAATAAAASLIVAPSRGRADAAPPAHLTWAENLVSTITPANNQYGSPASIQWAGVDGPVSSNTSVCSTFVTTLLKRAYNLTSTNFKTWMGSTSPSAEVYHDAIAVEHGFTRIAQVAALKAGDVIAIEYRDPDATSTGHVAVASSTPVDRGLVTKNGATLRTYDVWVIDSSRSYHGKSDTRYLKKDGANPDNGVGEGIMRIFAVPATGAIAGHTWSDLSGSDFYAQPGEDPSTGGRHLVIGRL
jgi:hypothetical protein